MAQAMTRSINKPAWVDLASKDAAGSRDFYSKLFGWDVAGQSGPAVRRLRAGEDRRPGRGRDRAGDGPQRADGLEPVHRHGRHRGPRHEGHRGRRDGRDGAVRRRRPGQDGRLPGPDRRLHLGLAGNADGRLRDDRAELVRLGRAQRPRRRQGASRSTSRSSAGPRRRARWARASRTTTSSRSTATSIAGAVEMPAGCAEPRCPAAGRSTSASPDVDAALREGDRARREDGVRAAGIPGRPVRHRDRPAGRLVRPAEDGPVAKRRSEHGCAGASRDAPALLMSDAQRVRRRRVPSLAAPPRPPAVSAATTAGASRNSRTSPAAMTVPTIPITNVLAIATESAEWIASTIAGHVRLHEAADVRGQRREQRRTRVADARQRLRPAASSRAPGRPRAARRPTTAPSAPRGSSCSRTRSP